MKFSEFEEIHQGRTARNVNKDNRTNFHFMHSLTLKRSDIMIFKKSVVLLASKSCNELQKKKHSSLAAKTNDA